MTAKTTILAALVVVGLQVSLLAQDRNLRFPDPIDLKVPHLTTDKSVKYDYDIVYVRAPRKGNVVGSKWAEIAHPVQMDPGADLMLLRPDGTEDVLVAGGKGAIMDPVVSLDGKSVY
jgi:hypothetical protein